METGLKVGDIMTRNVVFVSPDVNLHECARMIVKKKVGGLIIKKDGKLVGILTKKDIIWALVKKSRKDLKDIYAKDIMNRKVIHIKPSEDITSAVKKFKKYKVKRLPVVEGGKVIGLITIRDIIRIDPGLIQMIAESVKIKEEAEKLKRSDLIRSRDGGICERCGEYDVLTKVGVQSICNECVDKS